MVTICPLSSLATPEAVNYAKAVLQGYPPQMYAAMGYAFMSNFITITASSPNVSETIRRSFGSPLSEMVLECKFNQKNCNMTNFRVNFEKKMLYRILYHFRNFLIFENNKKKSTFGTFSVEAAGNSIVAST